MLRHYTAADLLAVSDGKQSLHAEPQVSGQPAPQPRVKPAVLVKPIALPAPRKRLVNAADILAIAQHGQPWHALEVPTECQNAAS